MVAAIAVLVFSSLSLAQDANIATWGGQATGPAGKANAAVTGSIDPHDLSGVWRLSRGTQNMSNAAPPMTPWAQAKFDANKPGFGPRAVPPVYGNDPIGDCNPLGLPRIHFFTWPVEFLQAPGRTIQFFEWNRVLREIWTDGRELPTDWEPRWFGYSVGKWEGDTFVVDSVGFDDRTWIDQYGYPHSTDMRLQERYRRVDQKTMELTMTITDPKAYTRPWVSDKKILEPLPQERWPFKELREEICAPANEESFNQKVRNPAGGATGK